jgi:DNA recombination protein RmuC
MDLLIIISSGLISSILTYIFALLYYKSKFISKSEFENLKIEYQNSKVELTLSSNQLDQLKELNNKNEEKIQDIQNKYSNLLQQATKLKADYDNLNNHFTNLKAELNDAKSKIDHDSEIIQILEKGKMEVELKNINLEERLSYQKNEIVELQKNAHLQFETIANKLLEEKSKNFTETNKSNIESLLNPLKDEINNFKQKIESTHTEDTKQRTSLESGIKILVEQTNKISSEANNLASALKGNSQKRGNWGEMILERILEMSGLEKDREYFVQESIKNDEGKDQRLDVKIHLPDKRIIIIDSKVSLIAFDKYNTAIEKNENNEEQKKFIVEHLNATKLHINQLSTKNYDNMEESLDFTMMFIPIEPAYLLAIQADPDLWEDAYKKRILLVSPTTLIACLKLFSDLWRREAQNRNAMDIVKRGESLYEKFVGFTDTFEDIGKKITSAQESYNKAISQFSQGKGNVISQAKELKKLGLKSTKEFKAEFLQNSNNKLND